MKTGVAAGIIGKGAEKGRRRRKEELIVMMARIETENKRRGTQRRMKEGLIVIAGMETDRRIGQKNSSQFHSF